MNQEITLKQTTRRFTSIRDLGETSWCAPDKLTWSLGLFSRFVIKISSVPLAAFCFVLFCEARILCIAYIVFRERAQAERDRWSGTTFLSEQEWSFICWSPFSATASFKWACHLCFCEFVVLCGSRARVRSNNRYNSHKRAHACSLLRIFCRGLDISGEYCIWKGSTVNINHAVDNGAIELG